MKWLLLGPSASSGNGRGLQQLLSVDKANEMWKTNRPNKGRQRLDTEKYVEAARIENMAWRIMGRDGGWPLPRAPMATGSEPSSTWAYSSCPLDAWQGGHMKRGSFATGCAPSDRAVRESPGEILDSVLDEPLEQWASATIAAKSGDVEEARRENMAWRLMHKESSQILAPEIVPAPADGKKDQVPVQETRVVVVPKNPPAVPAAQSQDI